MKLLCPHCGSPNITATVAQDQTGDTLYSCSACRDRCTMDELLAYSSAQAPKEKNGYKPRPISPKTTLSKPVLPGSGKENGDIGLSALTDKIEFGVKDLEKHNGLRQLTLPDVRRLARDVKELGPCLDKCDQQQAYAVYQRLCKTIMCFADLPVDYEGSSMGAVDCKWTGKHTYTRKYRIETWIYRALVIGTFARQLEQRQQDSLHGDDYRKMASSLWIACSAYDSSSLCSADIHADLTQWLIDRIIDRKIIGKAENKLRRQIQAKLQDPSAHVDLSYQSRDRNAVQTQMTVTTFLTILLVGGTIVWLNDRGILRDIISRKGLSFYDLCTKHPDLIFGLLSFLMFGALIMAGGTLLYSWFASDDK